MPRVKAGAVKASRSSTVSASRGVYRQAGSTSFTTSPAFPNSPVAGAEAEGAAVAPKRPAEGAGEEKTEVEEDWPNTEVVEVCPNMGEEVVVVAAPKREVEVVVAVPKREVEVVAAVPKREVEVVAAGCPKREVEEVWLKRAGAVVAAWPKPGAGLAPPNTAEGAAA